LTPAIVSPKLVGWMARAWVARWAAVLSATAVALGAVVPASHAQQRTTIVRVLRESSDFRARVRAAMALGASADPAMATVLAGALRDPEPAVRVAAAEGLARLGNSDALLALRDALSDPSREVREAAERAIRALSRPPLPPDGPPDRTAGAPAGPIESPGPANERPLSEGGVDWRGVRYAVVVGSMQNRSGFAAESLGRLLWGEVVRHLSAFRGVAVLTEPPTPEVDREIQRRGIARMRIEGTITRIQRDARGRELSVRCEVALVLMDEPGRNLRAALNGAATGSERLGRRAQACRAGPPGRGSQRDGGCCSSAVERGALRLRRRHALPTVAWRREPSRTIDMHHHVATDRDAGGEVATRAFVNAMRRSQSPARRSLPPASPRAW
jgi:hypothetical protein